MAKVEFLSFKEGSPASGYWDQALLTDMLNHYLIQNALANCDDSGAVMVIPGAYQADYLRFINRELEKYKWVILFITSDEESNFPVEEIKHLNCIIYVQYPKKGRHDQYKKLPLGYTSETRKRLDHSDKNINAFFSGQITNQRRRDFDEYFSPYVKKDNRSSYAMTDGFAAGFPAETYYKYMKRAKVAPSPSGPISPDSFRAYEALEYGAVPICDNISTAYDEQDYWRYLFGSNPLPTINDYSNLPGYIDDILKVYPTKNIQVQSWWIKKKHDLIMEIKRDIEKLSHREYQEMVTAIVLTSPIKSNPSTAIIEETIRSIKKQMPQAQIYIGFDGVREEQEHLRENYNQFIQKALYLCNTEWDAVPFVFDKHMHQVGMTRAILDQVNTPTVLFVEHDTPLVTDEVIDWIDLIEAIRLCEANVIRFHYEANIPKEHQHLMIDVPQNGLLKTIQWSQRPHLASTDFYKHILKTYFSDDARCFIEDKLHGVVQQEYAEMGFRGWDRWKLFIYYPDVKNIKRSLNLDGREGAEKFDDSQIF